jgi:hypothetical protein
LSVRSAEEAERATGGHESASAAGESADQNLIEERRSQIPLESTSPEGRSIFDYGTGIRTDLVRNKLWFIEENVKMKNYKITVN